MTIATTIASISYVTDGSTTVFSLPSLVYIDSTSIKATHIDSSTNVVTNLTNGADFTLSGDGAVGSGVLTTATALATGTIEIYREGAVVQSRTFTDNNGSPAKQFEEALDDITLLAQEGFDRASRGLQRRAGDTSVDMTLPLLSARKGKLLAFNGQTGLPETELSAGNVSLLIAGGLNGFSVANLETVATSAEMTALPKSSLNDRDRIQTLSGSSIGDGGHGLWEWRASSTVAADIGTALAHNEGGAGRFHRLFDGPVNVRWFGAKGDGVTNDSPAFQAAIDYTIVNGQGSVSIPTGNFVWNNPVGIDVGANDTTANLEIFGTGPDSVIIANYHATTEEEGLLFFKANEVAGINLRRITVRDLKINMNLKRGTAIFGRILTACQLRNLWIGGQANDAASIYPSIYLKNCAQTTVTGSVLNHNPNSFSIYGGAGIRLHSTNYASGLSAFRSKNLISNNTFGEQLKHAVEIEAEVNAAQGGNSVVGNTVFNVHSDAFRLLNVDHNVISSNTLDDIRTGAVGILIDSSSHNTIIGNAFTDAGQDFIKLDGQSAAAENCIGNIIQGNTFKVDDVAAQYAINISDANCVDTLVSGNTFEGSFSGGQVNDVGDGTILQRQPGLARALQYSPPGTAPAMDATPSVAGVNSINLQPNTTYTMFDDGIDGQPLFVRGAVGAHLVSSATLRLAGGADFITVDSNTVLWFLYFGDAWWEGPRNFGTPQNRGTAIPTTGYHVQGEIIWRSNVVAGGNIGWVCVTPGIPGIWKAFGTVDP